MDKAAQTRSITLDDVRAMREHDPGGERLVEDTTDTADECNCTMAVAPDPTADSRSAPPKSCEASARKVRRGGSWRCRRRGTGSFPRGWKMLRRTCDELGRVAELDRGGFRVGDEYVNHLK